jgi:hypothetical protein
LNDELSKIDSMNVPGGSVQFLSASDGALSMRRRFDRPVAIGYRAVQISVDPADGLIVGLGAAANRVAQVTAGDESTTAQALCDEITKQLTAAGAGTFIIRATTGDTLVFDCRAQGATNLTAATLDERIKAMAPQIAQAVRSADSTLNDAQKALLERFESKAFSVVLDAE